MNRHYEPDHPGTAELMRSREVRAFLENVAEDAKRTAEGIAPVDTGEYRDSFRIEPGEDTVAGTRRAVVNLVNDSDHAAVVESRTHVLSRVKDVIEQTYG